ncbi:MAG TPA: hypothetical protein DC049_19045, partial [Spirochaetia bacterium]|nr:hypothetical protein [Spirochaetia bacterium]
ELKSNPNSIKVGMKVNVNKANLGKNGFNERKGTGGDSLVAPGKGTISVNGLKALAKWEGSVTVDGKHVIYDDATGKPITKYKEGATIGYGHLITSVEEFTTFKNGITEKQALKMLSGDGASAISVVNSALKVNVSQDQFDAMVSLAYNIGNGSFKTSSALKLINNLNAPSSYSSIESAWKAWNKGTINGERQVIPGLQNRRSNEWIYYTKGTY